MPYKVLHAFDQSGKRAYVADEIISDIDLTPDQLKRAIERGDIVEVPVYHDKVADKPASTVMPKGKR